MANSAFAAKSVRDSQSMLNQILQSPLEDSDSLGVIRKIIRCDECSSRQAAVCSVELRFFCMSHFVDHCYQRLAESEKALGNGLRRESLLGFLRECATQAAKLLLLREELQNIERARLFDIILWSNELCNKLLSKSVAKYEQPIPASS